MTAVAQSTTTALTVRVYKNGNPNFSGKNFVVNRRYIRTMEALYDEITAHIGPSNAVRNIYTPQRGRRVESLENLMNRNIYVAAGREGFKKLNYADLGVVKPRPPRKTNNFPKKGVFAVQGRHKMDYEWGKRELKIIYVFCNGDVFRPSVKIVLQKRLQQSMDQILNIVQEHVVLAAAIAVLFTIDGKPIFQPSQLINGGNYVAVERGRSFKKENYGSLNLSLNRSPRAPILPPIGNGQMTNQEGRPPRKRVGKKKPEAAKQKAADQSRDHSRITASVISPREMESNLSASEGATKVSESQDLDLALSTTPLALVDLQTTPSPEAALVTSLKREEEYTTSGDVFKASGLQSVKAEEVKDNRQTTVEKPLDLLPAEEVEEEMEVEKDQEMGDELVVEDDQDEKAGIEVERTQNSRADRSPSDLVDEINDDALPSIEDDLPKPVVNEDERRGSQVQAWSNVSNDARPKSSENERETANVSRNSERPRSSSVGEAISESQEGKLSKETEANEIEKNVTDRDQETSAQDKLDSNEGKEEEELNEIANKSGEPQPKSDLEEANNDQDAVNSSEANKPTSEAQEDQNAGKETTSDSQPAANDPGDPTAGSNTNSNNTYFS